GAVHATTPAAGQAAMNQFAAATREWFLGAFGSPTPAQAGAWDAIAGGAHSLVVAPTGSGKTLAAFLWALDGLIARAPGGSTTADPAQLPIVGFGGAAAETRTSGTTGARRSARDGGGTRVLYISPLKALGVDVERNLRAPLIGITQTAARLGLEAPHVSV